MIYATLAAIFNVLIIYFMPKRVSRLEIYVTWMILAAISMFTDMTYGIVWDQYDYGPSGGVEFYSMMLAQFLSPAFGVIFYNYMPREWSRYLPYLFAWVAFSVLFEWGSTFIGYLRYNDWSLWRSTCFYFSTFFFLRWHYFWLHERLQRKQ